jgi:hypothetical protein
MYAPNMVRIDLKYILFYKNIIITFLNCASVFI